MNITDWVEYCRKNMYMIIEREKQKPKANEQVIETASYVLNNEDALQECAVADALGDLHHVVSTIMDARNKFRNNRTYFDLMIELNLGNRLASRGLSGVDLMNADIEQIKRTVRSCIGLGSSSYDMLCQSIDYTNDTNSPSILKWEEMLERTRNNDFQFEALKEGPRV